LILGVFAILLGAGIGCARRDSSLEGIAALEAAAAAAIEARDHCAAADSLLRLGAAYELRLQWAAAYDATRRGIDVWAPATTLDFLLRE
jgi:hypothetical protein